LAARRDRAAVWLRRDGGAGAGARAACVMSGWLACQAYALLQRAVQRQPRALDRRAAVVVAGAQVRARPAPRRAVDA